MNPQEVKDHLQSNLLDMIVEVEENYSNQHANNATRFIFTKGELKTNLMFKQGFKLDPEVLSGVIEAIRKKFASAPIKEQIKQTVAVVKENTEQSVNTAEIKTPGQTDELFYELYKAAKNVVEAYERDNPMT
jgi:hypothetical protein